MDEVTIMQLSPKVLQLSPANHHFTIVPHSPITDHMVCVIALTKHNIITCLVLSQGFVSDPALCWSQGKGNFMLQQCCHKLSDKQNYAHSVMCWIIYCCLIYMRRRPNCSSNCMQSRQRTDFRQGTQLEEVGDNGTAFRFLNSRFCMHLHIDSEVFRFSSIF